MFKFRKAVLIIHGFAGGTYDEEPLFFHLQPKLEFDVYNFTLTGHKTNLSTDVSYTDWLKDVDERINLLRNMGYKKIYVIGHSMGGLLATHAAIKYVEVKKVVLVAPAFQFLSTDKKQSTISKALKSGPDIIKTYQAKEVLARALKVSVHQLKEFIKLVELSQSNPGMLSVPTLIIQGLSDQLVPYKSSENIFNEMVCPKWLIEVEKTTHDVFFGPKVDEINEEIARFLKEKHYKAEEKRKW